jgi:16S rRNA C967 or C1407 C5-methylase (RsmB/RsmF family)/NOL1/NOP2/fmu family ribosome biogenesis protein
VSGSDRPRPDRPALPPAFLERMRTLLGERDAAELAAALERPAQRGLRLQHDRIDLATLTSLVPWRLDPLPWTPHGYRLDAGEDAPGATPLHEAGAFYLQDPAAMAPAAALAVRPGDRVIDLAAAPGGKATALAADLAAAGEAAGGVLVANDVHPGRLAALARNLERVGARSARITRATPAAWARQAPERFDAVLLDAPCSGEGMFRKSDEARRAWSPRTVAACAARQDEALTHAARLLAPGGRLLYATCTFAPEENEAVVAALLRRRPDLRLVTLRMAGTEPGLPTAVGADDLPARGWARIWPQRAPGDGHVLALLERDPDAAPGDGASAGRERAREEPAGTRSRRGRRRRDRTDARGDAERAASPEARAAWRAFARDAAPGLGDVPDDALVEQGGVVWRRAGGAELSGLPSLRPGLALGRFQNGRWIPSHALAQALRPGEARARLTLPAAGAAARDWLSGEERDPERLRDEGAELHGDPPEGGWTQVVVAGCGLGWARVDARRVRNLYPKGLRRPG